MNMKLNYSTIHNAPISFDCHSFVQIVVNYYNIQSDITNNIYYILHEIENKYTTFFRNVPYENIVLGTILYAVNEYQKYYELNSPPLTIDEFVIDMYGIERKRCNMIQIYSVYLTLSEMLEDTDFT